MTAINGLGDRLLVVLNQTNNFTTTIALNPPIQNQKFFRAICNNICVINCDFSKYIYSVDAEGNLSQSKNIIVGKEDYWYPVLTSLINNTTISLVSPSPTTFSNPISIYFEFVTEVPSDLMKKF